ncbi:MAG: cupin domain-containing protein, partial [Rubrobacter sp.]
HYVSEGRFEFVIEGGEKIEVDPGSLVYVPKGTLHAFENVGETAGRLLVIQTPGGSYEHLLQEAGRPAADVAPDAVRFTEIAVDYGMEMIATHHNRLRS